MELNSYQEKVVADLADYLTVLEESNNLEIAFKQYWTARGATGMDAYKNNVPGVPHVCAKVPTAGGKTFIAVNALRTIFDALTRRDPSRAKLSVWLVPSLTILEQTVKNLSDPEHPYRRKLNVLFNGRVAIYEKRDLLQGAGFSLDSVSGQLSIVVMSYDSLRARNKEDRKIYQDNGYLASFATAPGTADWLHPDYDATALINVIRRLKPVVVVDESHNAETALSVEMLWNLNPDFIFDLTATPRNNSNIISYVDALKLKDRHMVKLPVIVANRQDRAEVIESALILRKQLESIAEAEETKGGVYIRPIVLFQAQPKTSEDNETFEKIRDKLKELQIPAEQIKIKTADINELKGLDLLSRDCPVRYIITVNALKEGWDCPFAYILASLADKSSAIDVEQILGRVLRMPHVRRHGHDLLNVSYVFTASSRFLDTLQSVVKALNRAGFSEHDCRAIEVPAIESQDGATPIPLPLTGSLFFEDSAANGVSIEPAKTEASDLDVSQAAGWEQAAQTLDAAGASFVETVKQEALAQNQKYEEKARAAEADTVPQELEDKMNKHRLKDLFRDDALALKLPQFFIRVERGGWFSDEQQLQLFEREELLKDFRLSQQDATVSFEDVESEMYRVDLEQIGKEESAPKPFKIDAASRARFNEIILAQSQEGRIHSVTDRLSKLIGNMYPITDPEIKQYVGRIVGAMTPEQIRDCLGRDFAYVRKLKDKIQTLANAHGEKRFSDLLDVDRVVTQPAFTLPESIAPPANAPAIPKSLYVTEAEIGDFERRIINDIANLENIHWWHRNLSRGKGFRINGFINHYPDFIVRTLAGKTIALETKGADRDNSDSEMKLKLGKLWEAKAGGAFKYMMVFDSNPMDGADSLANALNKLKQM